MIFLKNAVKKIFQTVVDSRFKTEIDEIMKLMLFYGVFIAN